jgi:hypothetical protein
LYALSFRLEVMVHVRRKRPKAAVWVVAIIGLLILCPTTAFLIGFGPVDIGPASRDLDRAAAAYRATGLPWEAKGLTPNPPVSDAENGAAPLQQAIALFNLRHWDKDNADMQTLLSKNDFSGAEKILETYHDALSQTEKALVFKGVDFHYDWDLGPNIRFQEFAPMKGLATAFCTRARIAASKGDLNATLLDLRKAEKLAEFTGSQPTIISLLVKVALQQVMVKTFATCGAMFRGNAPALESLRNSLKGVDLKSDFTYYLRGEAYMGLAILRNFSAYGGLSGLRRMSSGDDDSGSQLPPINPDTLQRTGLPTGLWARAFADHHLKAWTLLATMLKQDGSDPVKYGPDADKVLNLTLNKRSLSGLLDEILFPVFSQAGLAPLRVAGSEEATDALLESLEIQARTGKLPTSMSQLTGHWVGPFDRQPLHMVVKGNSFRIYTPNIDGVDHGGVDPSEAKDFNDSDIVAAYPPIAKKK